MNDLEQHLTDLMTAHAERSPDDLGLLSRVEAASARRTRVRRFGALGLAVAAVAGVALGATVLTGGKPAADRFSDPTGFLVDGRSRVAQFPLTPGYLHPRLSEKVSIEPYDAAGRYGSASWWFPKVPGTGTPQDTITVLPSAPQEFPGATSVQVNGIAGHESKDCGALVCALTWRRGPAQFVQVLVMSASGGAKQEAYAVAAGLVDKPIVAHQVLVLGLVPAADCVLQMPRRFADGTTSTSYIGTGPCAFGASVEVAEVGLAPRGRAVHLGGRDGTLNEESMRGTRNGKRVLVPVWGAAFPLGNGRQLLLTVPRSGGWNLEELDRFVGAIILPKG